MIEHQNCMPIQREFNCQIELIKCPKCKWVHFIMEEGGLDKCFSCGAYAKDMIPAVEADCPVGCTMQGINQAAKYGGVK